MQNLGELIPIEKITPDTTNFRTFVNPILMEEMTKSVAEKGVLEPLLVRPNGDGTFTIIAGERRYIAGNKAGLKELPCIIKDISAEEAKDLQLHENVHREDLTPMDEARMYLFFLKKIRKVENLSADDLTVIPQSELLEIAAITHKNPDFIQRRIRLNNLIEEYQKDIEEGFLKVSSGYVLCVYDPETQRQAKDIIYKSTFVRKSNDPESPDYREGEHIHARENGEAKTSTELANYFEWRMRADLTKAVFPLDSTELLRIDGKSVACNNCEFRTGANAGFFDVSAEDYCLNPPCLKNKTVQFCQITRTKEQPKQEEEILLLGRDWNNPAEGFLSRSDYKILDFDNEDESRQDQTCAELRAGISEETGKLVDVCLKSSCCSVHYPYESERQSKTAEENPEQIEQKKADRKEELWNAKVADAVRLIVIAESAKVFAHRNTDKAGFLQPFFARLFQTLQYNHRRHVVALLEMAGMPNLPEQIENNDYETALMKMGTEKQLVLGFILTHYWKGDCSVTKRLEPQYQIIGIAEEFAINYELIDAQVRAELAPKKFEKAHKLYLHEVINNVATRQIPKLYTKLEEKPILEEEPKSVVEEIIEVAEALPEVVPNPLEVATEIVDRRHAVEVTESVKGNVQSVRISPVETSSKKEPFEFFVPQSSLKKFADTSQCAEIANSQKITKTFMFNGKEYACTGSCGGGNGYSEVDAYEVISADDYEGETIGYGGLNPETGYEGMKLKYKKGEVVLTNCTIFRDETDEYANEDIPFDETELKAEDPANTEKAEETPEISDNEPIIEADGDTSERFECAYCGEPTTFDQSPDGIVCPKCDEKSGLPELDAGEISDIFKQ